MFFQLLTALLYFNTNIVCDEVKDFEKYLLNNITTFKNWKNPTRNEYFKNIQSEKCTNYSESFDFVIVGAGAAGCVLANRLSENSKWKILLIEAGGDGENILSEVPGTKNIVLNTTLNWGYLSVRQKNFCLETGGICGIQRGLGLGGSTLINGMLYVRANKYDFKKWVDLGNTGWSYEEVLPYYKKQETTRDFKDSFYRGTKGPLNITIPYQITDLYKSIFEGNKEMGYQVVDYNAAGQIGIGFAQATTLGGKRLNTNKAYLKPIRTRKNLTVFTKTLATRIVFKENRADRLQILRGDNCNWIKINKELIVSSGTINTPQLLILSGIGPKDHLNELSIKLYKDLPVGKNLQDRPSVMDKIMISTNLTFSNRTFDGDVKQYLFNGSGILTTSSGMDIGFYNYNSTKNTDKPIVEVFYTPGNVILTPEEYKTDKAKKISFSFNPLLEYPKSVGELKLKSKNPLDFPIIDPKYLQNPDDINGLYLGIVKLQELLQTKAMRKINATLATPVPQACKSAGNKNSKTYWECFIKQIGHGVYHPLGTCRMGLNTSDSVVDRKLKVHGVDNLRVVDASVFPTFISGHLQATVVAVAEKISDEIKKMYQ